LLAGADEAAGAELEDELSELDEADDPLVEPVVSEELFDAPSPEALLPTAALSAAVTAGAASLVLTLALSPPPF
jgi:hypothetical protein